MIELRGYIDEKGIARFATWLDSLDPTAAAKVTIAPYAHGAEKFLEHQERRGGRV